MIPLESIAFDIDGVVANTMGLFIDIVREKYDISISYDQITHYDLTQCLDIEFDIIWETLQQIMNGNHTQKLRPIDQAPNALQRLSQKSDRLLFITARPDAIPLESWFREALRLPESRFKIVATGDFQQKLAILDEHQIKYFVEDRMETCRLIYNNGFVPIVFRQPWNRESHSFIEVQSWDEIVAMID
ncbi:MAG: haloacid dehalogenase [Candidatus Magnetoglobus multicellularis str. Araruama]|uniref:Haloacid dehalogenase n=1 Tax=Candidatus Magnetoglobus multicellularis str. Araruama TaxID=890399 RepID=A0A1V1P855_9BACT|nr:MAG: haloacid dehalogenase [Candidatus Magnetoglobus multicellularis str. Araruama]